MRMAKDFTTGVVRDRGQLTIPDSLRSQLPWLASNSLVYLSSTKPDELVITPTTPTTNWDLIWSTMKLLRTQCYDGPSATEIIRTDRDSR